METPLEKTSASKKRPLNLNDDDEGKEVVAKKASPITERKAEMSDDIRRQRVHDNLVSVSKLRELKFFTLVQALANRRSWEI